MNPITLWVRVDLAREEAFALLDEFANHVVDWSFDGPAAGVAGPGRARAIIPRAIVEFVPAP